MEGRLDQIQESMAQNLDQTTTQIDAIGDQIAQLQQKLQTTGEEITQKIMAALEAFHRLEKEKTISTEVQTLTTSSPVNTPTITEPVSLPPSITNPLSSLQFGTTNLTFPATQVLSTNIPPSTQSIPYTTVPPIVTAPELINRTIMVNPTLSNSIRGPSYNSSMMGWYPYSDMIGTMGNMVSTHTYTQPVYTTKFTSHKYASQHTESPNLFQQ